MTIPGPIPPHRPPRVVRGRGILVALAVLAASTATPIDGSAERSEHATVAAYPVRARET
jgi:hypothetical protein